jgi:hypothetical protein
LSVFGSSDYGWKVNGLIIPAVAASELVLALLGAVASTMTWLVAIDALDLDSLDWSTILLAAASSVAHF